MSYSSRHIEIDLLRSLAIVLMVFFHLCFDLENFYNWNIDTDHGLLWWIGRISAVLFLLLVGISFSISWQRTTTRSNDSRLPLLASSFLLSYKKYFIRSMHLLSWALVISLLTAVAMPDEYIRFGILHLIGTATLLLPFFVFAKEWTVLLGIVCIALGSFTKTIIAGTPFLLPLGMMPLHFSSLDYYPLLPWLGVILIGLGAGQLLYVRKNFRSPMSGNIYENLSIPGRYSLWIYLAHQPMLLAGLWLMHR